MLKPSHTIKVGSGSGCMHGVLPAYLTFSFPIASKQGEGKRRGKPGTSCM